MRNTEFTRSYIGKWIREPYGYKSTSSTSSTDEWYQSRGSAEWVYKVLNEEEYEYTHYVVPPLNKSSPKLPDEYPKGNLDDLLTFDTE